MLNIKKIFTGDGAVSKKKDTSINRCLISSGKTGCPSHKSKDTPKVVCNKVRDPCPYSPILNSQDVGEVKTPPMEEVVTLPNVPAPLCSLSKDVKMYIRKCVDSIFTIFKLYGFDPKDYKLKTEYERYYKLVSMFGGDWVKFFKTKLSAFRAHHVKQLLPDVKLDLNIFKPGFILGGKAYRFQQLMKLREPELFSSFIISIVRSKGSMPKPTLGHLNQAIVDTFKALTTPRWDVPNHQLVHRDLLNNNVMGFLSRDNIAQQIRRTVNEVFRNKTFDFSNIVEPYFPSTNANYNNAKSDLGTVGLILRDAPEWLKDNFTYPLIDGSVTGNRELFPVIDNTQLYRCFNSLWTYAKAKAISEIPNAEPVALPEALKTRVITKGPPYKYFILKPLQKFMWNTMRQFDNFKLISQPISGDLLRRMFPYEELNHDDKFLSVDYSDATNQLHSWCSRIALDELCDILDLDIDYRRIARDSLVNHNICVEKGDDETMIKQIESEPTLDDYVTGKQRNGQLMGSILSFPFLCLINASIIRWALEMDTGKSLVLSRDLSRPNSARFVVNGDDGLFRSSLLGKYYWEQIASRCGLKPSIGKVFFSSDFFEINSENYTVSSTPLYSTFVDYSSSYPVTKGYPNHYIRTPYVNSGILSGMQRSGGISKDANHGSDNKLDYIGSNCQYLIDSCPESIRSKVYQQFLDNNKDFLKRCHNYNIPLFVPTQFGGVGLPIFENCRPTDLDLRLMRKFYYHTDVYKLPGKIKSSWKVWSLVQNAKKKLHLEQTARLFANEFLFKENQLQGERNNRTFLTKESLEAQLAVEVLLLAKDPKDLYEKNKKGEKVSNETSALKKLSVFWKSLLKPNHIKLPEPFNIDNIPLKVPCQPEVYCVNNEFSNKELVELYSLAKMTYL